MYVVLYLNKRQRISKGNQEWTFQRHRQHWIEDTDKANTTWTPAKTKPGVNPGAHEG